MGIRVAIFAAVLNISSSLFEIQVNNMLNVVSNTHLCCAKCNEKSTGERNKYQITS